MLSRRAFLGGAAGAAGLSVAAHAQTSVRGWPAQPVRVVYPSGPGGPGELFRLYADHFKAVFGQPFVLENRAGASGAIGILQVGRSAPDGHTLLCSSASSAVYAPLLAAKPAFELQRDFEPIAMIFTWPYLLVINRDLPVQTLAEFVSYARSKPGELNFGSPGVGSGGHLMTSLFLRRHDIKAVHIPFTSAPAYGMGTASGQLHFTFSNIGTVRSFLDNGQIRPLGVTGTRRALAAPDIPTFEEQGFANFNFHLWIGLFAPAGTPTPVLDALNRETIACMNKPEVERRLTLGAYEISSLTRPEFNSFIANELNVWRNVVDETGLRQQT